MGFTPTIGERAAIFFISVTGESVYRGGIVTDIIPEGSDFNDMVLPEDLPVLDLDDGHGLPEDMDTVRTFVRSPMDPDHWMTIQDGGPCLWDEDAFTLSMDFGPFRVAVASDVGALDD